MCSDTESYKNAWDQEEACGRPSRSAQRITEACDNSYEKKTGRLASALRITWQATEVCTEEHRKRSVHTIQSPWKLCVQWRPYVNSRSHEESYGTLRIFLQAHTRKATENSTVSNESTITDLRKVHRELRKSTETSTDQSGRLAGSQRARQKSKKNTTEEIAEGFRIFLEAHGKLQNLLRNETDDSRKAASLCKKTVVQFT